MGPPSYMRSVVDRNVVMRRIIVNICLHLTKLSHIFKPTLCDSSLRAAFLKTMNDILSYA